MKHLNETRIFEDKPYYLKTQTGYRKVRPAFVDWDTLSFVDTICSDTFDTEEEALQSHLEREGVRILCAVLEGKLATTGKPYLALDKAIEQLHHYGYKIVKEDR